MVSATECTRLRAPVGRWPDAPGSTQLSERSVTYGPTRESAGDVKWRTGEGARCRNKEVTMKYSSGHQQKDEKVRRSSSLAINPYFIDDVALTRSDIDQLRRSAVMVIAPR
jgi:hypothetical protein